MVSRLLGETQQDLYRVRIEQYIFHDYFLTLPRECKEFVLCGVSNHETRTPIPISQMKTSVKARAILFSKQSASTLFSRNSEQLWFAQNWLGFGFPIFLPSFRFGRSLMSVLHTFSKLVWTSLNCNDSRTLLHRVLSGSSVYNSLVPGDLQLCVHVLSLVLFTSSSSPCLESRFWSLKSQVLSL